MDSKARIAKEHGFFAQLNKTTALAGLGLLMAAPGAFAQTSQSQAGTAPSANAGAVNAEMSASDLLELLVQNGVVTRAQADAIGRQAAQQAAAQPRPPGAVTPSAVTPSAEPGVQTVIHIPEPVREQLREEVRREVFARAREENWAAPNAAPEWTRRITVAGGVRVRAESIAFDENNFPSFPNINAINQGSGQDINLGGPEYANPPYLNTLEDRTRARIRANLGITARIDEGISAEVAFATGNDASPVSTNQSLGDDGTGKYALWLDRANIRFNPAEDVTLVVGRFGNPFDASDLLFDSDMNFDGVALSGRRALGESVGLFGTLGVFPIFNTSLHFGSNDAGPFESTDRYLSALQIGFDVGEAERTRFSAAVGYFNFGDAKGEFSSPCLYYQDVCDTDATRPAFVQFGNTYMPLRIPDFTGSPNPALEPEYQYFGLASDFEIAHLRTTLDTGALGPHLRLELDYVNNLGFDRDDVAGANFVNPTGKDPVTGLPLFAYEPGGEGWRINAQLGAPRINAFGDWNVSVGYRYLESDAVLDAFTDSDFHLGGTNAEGFTLGAAFGLGRNTAISGRYLSANEISGAPYAVDVFQLDLSTRF